MAKKTKKTQDTVMRGEPEFTKAALLRSAMFAGKRDALSVALSDGEVYTIDGAIKALEKFMRER